MSQERDQAKKHSSSAGKAGKSSHISSHIPSHDVMATTESVTVGLYSINYTYTVYVGCVWGGCECVGECE